MYFVYRQHYYYQDIKVVEIAYPSIDYSSPDMLTPKYAGEGESYPDPREALQTAISIMEAWKKDAPDEDISIVRGCFDGLEGESDTIEELTQWANSAYEKLPKCDFCGEILNEKEYYTNEDSQFTDEKFCSEYHAERAFWSSLDICKICEKEVPRSDLNEIGICEECQIKESGD